MKPSRDLQTFITACRKDVRVFARDMMNFHPTDQQDEALGLVQAHAERRPGYKKRICIKSGQGTGKTAIMCIVGAWRTWRSGKTQTVVTAPSMNQCRDVYLAEFGIQHEKAHPIWRQMCEVTASRVFFFEDKRWRLIPKTSATVEGSQGFHDKHLTILMEEMSGIDRAIVEQYEGTLTNDDALMMCIGNPNTRDSAMFDCFTIASEQWSLLTFSGEKSPNVNKENIEYLAAKYGRNSDVYRVRVLGEFPKTDPDCIISMEDCVACAKKPPGMFLSAKRRWGENVDPAKQVGIDLAAYGGDECVVYRRQGNSVVEAWDDINQDPNVAVDKALEMQARAGWFNRSMIFVPDASGMGQGLLRRFSEADRIFYPYIATASPPDPIYQDLQAWAWFNLKDYIENRACSIPNDERLLRQLSTRRYFLNKKGKIALEPKDAYKKRGFSSPDRADALVMAFCDSATMVGRAISIERPRPGSVKRPRMRGRIIG